jgi:hypothetical protein
MSQTVVEKQLNTSLNQLARLHAQPVLWPMPWGMA